MKAFRSLFLILCTLAAAAWADDQITFSVAGDGNGAFRYSWEKEIVAEVFDFDNNGKPDLATYLWGERATAIFIDTDSDGRYDTMATFGEDGSANWYTKQDEAGYLSISDDRSPVIAKARELFKSSIVKRVSIDDGSLALSEIAADGAPSIAMDSHEPESDLTIILFPAPSASGKTVDSARNSDALPFPLRYPPVRVKKGRFTYSSFENLTVAKDPFDPEKVSRASGKLRIFPYRVEWPPRLDGSAAPATDRIQMCFHIRVEKERDDRFCVDEPITEGAPFFAHAPSTDFTGKVQGSWLIEIHAKPAGNE
jgi:hypothetical protein